ncbi:MAG: PilN domain-containing protein [Terracidiphilus sp.]|jgi:type IV pilus assembly protein PilN
MRITLNLATRPYADLGPALKRLRIAMAVLLVLAAGFILGLHALHQKAEEARATEERVQNRIDAIKRERQGYQQMMSEPANVQLLSQVTALNQLIDEKTFSWTLAMEDLETVLPAGVQVTSLDPSRDTKTGVITLKLRVVGARDRADDLVQNLEHSRHFMMPHIVSESSEATAGANQRLEPVSASSRFNFELQAAYNPVAPDERRKEERQKKEKPAADGDRAAKDSLPARRVAAPTALPLSPAVARHAPFRPPSAPPPQPAAVFPQPNQPPNPNPHRAPISGGPR